ncbi:hypothetical protein [Streptomyces beijiangensis]|uniref:Uncharacterized protein n=1 Tax=Streptomyces beijiangensis TaxID=163361 RepID=A0A939JJG3_9ACTN|nr:hypothetical protein [Streptomyces beijiangensis]MBO0514220.1 hypothetical protein [Streptomyces beijiangensis]
MLAFVAAVLFAIAFILHVTETSTDLVFAPTSLMFLGLAFLALHVGGVGTGWAARGRGRSRRR